MQKSSPLVSTVYPVFMLSICDILLAAWPSWTMFSSLAQSQRLSERSVTLCLADFLLDIGSQYLLLIQAFFGPISNKCRVVDLPENWGFWKFPLYFWGNSWLYQQFCMVLDQNSKILQKIFIYFRKSCRNFESLEKNSWVIVFSPWVLEGMSKQKTCSNPKISKHSLYTGDEKKIVSLNKNDWSKNETTVDCFWKLQTNEI